MGKIKINQSNYRERLLFIRGSGGTEKKMVGYFQSMTHSNIED
jgi:hypothetical protein